MSGFTYTIVNNTITGATGSGEAIIPDSVTAIPLAYEVFRGNTNITKLTVSTNSLLSSIQYSSFVGCQNLTEITLGTTLLKRIESNTFYGCNISSIAIPEGITYIGDSCFYACASLSNVTFPSTLVTFGTTCFEGCPIRSIVIPDSVRSLGSYPFGGNTLITNITFNPTYISGSLGNAAVSQRITSVTLSANTTIISDSALTYYGISSINIPNSVTVIGNYAFQYCTSLSFITLSSNIVSIGWNAFAYSNLTSITIPDSVTSVQYGAFICPLVSITYKPDNVNADNVFTKTYVTSLTLSPTSTVLQYCNALPLLPSIVIPNNVRGIGGLVNCPSLTEITIDYYNSKIVGIAGGYGGDGFASNCGLLTSITIPKSVTSAIGYGTFLSCPSLKNIVMNTNVYQLTYYLPKSFTNVTVMDDSYTIAQSCFNGWNQFKFINIPSTVTSIAGSAFGGCTSLTSITGESVTVILDNAFDGCTALTSATFPNNRRVYPNAFLGCTALASFIFPKSTTSVDVNSSFRNCTSLSSVTLSSSLYIQDSVKSQLTSVTIYSDSTLVIGAFMRGASKLSSIIIPPSVTYIQNEAFNGCTNLSLVDLSADTSVLRVIDFYAFLDCPSLHDISLPGTVTTYGDWRPAFGGTTRLQHVTFKPNATGNFSSFTYLTSATISADATFLSPSQFRYCSSLTNVIIPDGVTAIPDYCFDHCTSLSFITIPNNVKRIGQNSIAYVGITSITFPSSVTFINNYGCCACPNLKDITVLGTGVTILYSFTANNSMTSITLNSATVGDYFIQTDNYQGSVTTLVINGVCTFSAQAFTFGGNLIKNLTYNSSIMNFADIRISANNITSCTLLPGSTVIPTLPNLSYMSIPDSISLTTISSTLFQGKTSLTNVILPASVTSIEPNAFKNCSSLPYFNIPNNVISLGSSAFLGCSALTGVSIPTSIVQLPDNVFQNCSSLKSVVIPNTVTNLGASAFQGCSSLTEMSLPNTITQLASSVFQSCSSLKTANLPHSITLLNSNSFNGCSSMTYVTINSQKITIGSYTFANCTKLARVDIHENLTMLSAFSSTLGLNDMNLRLIGTTDPPTYIADNAFLNDISLNFFSIPITTTSIGLHAFDGCISLHDIVIPVNVQYVYEYAFRGCTSMTDVIINANRTYTQLSTNSFQNTPLIPKSTKDALLTKGYSAAYLMNAGFVNVRPLPCFKEDTKILCFVDGEEKELFVQDIRKGVLVKTRLHGYLPVDMIGKSKMYNPNNQERYTDRLYLCSQENYPELNEDLVITGCHAILVDDFKEGQREKTVNKFGRVFVTDKKYRLIAEFDERAIPYKYEGNFNIYHIALENESYYGNYGIFANGLLVESCSKRYLKEISKMTLL
jgi:hypothetical protein